MNSIQRLDPGTGIELAGGLIAEVEQNPRDGVWLLARFRTGAVPASDAVELISRAFEESSHGAVSFRESESPDVFLYVHADDIRCLPAVPPTSG